MPTAHRPLMQTSVTFGTAVLAYLAALAALTVLDGLWLGLSLIHI